MSSPKRTLTELLARADRVIAESLHALFKTRGLSVAEWRVLAAPAERDGLPMVDLAQKLLFRQPTLSKVIDRMERALLVHRAASPQDRRQCLVVLTERGQQLAAQVILNIRQRDALIARSIGKARTRKLRVGLTRLITLVEQVPPWAMRRGRASHTPNSPDSPHPPHAPVKAA
jgi:MarR family transcriptional regulator, organic hydroperoxide resistance regulator